MSKSSSTTKKTLPYAHIAFLISGFLLLLYYLFTKGVPSLGKDVASIITFVVDLIVLISAIGFYCYMVFSPKGLTGTIRALAPALVIFVVMGQYSMPSVQPDINRIVSAIATGAATLIVFCGFLFVFLHKWIFGEIFGWSCFVYAIYVIVAYFVITIMGLVDGGKFDVMMLLSSICLFMASGLMAYGALRICKSKNPLD